MSNVDPADPSSRLEAAFNAIHERMRGLAFINPALRVEAIAFAPWKTYWLGVMLTPWSMNLMLTPREAAAWRSLPAGDKRRYTFPAGAYDFISARDDTLGEYLVCSLFSPVLEFADHETARQTAQLARDALFDAANAETGAGNELTPALANADSSTDAHPGPLARLEQTLASPISRRDLLHGHLPTDTHADRG
jgi:[NiFe] hydrogenase assembly HybE family chaperone